MNKISTILKSQISITNFCFVSGSIMAQHGTAPSPQTEGGEPSIIQIIINRYLIIINYPNYPEPQNWHCSLCDYLALSQGPVRIPVGNVYFSDPVSFFLLSRHLITIAT